MFMEKHAIPCLLLFIISLVLGTAGTTFGITGTVMADINFKTLG